ncbi:MAG: guanine deaminase [Betaproteobacteria bacterium]|nr:guanine deaminase [Betaproteobacteria bacterium]NBT09630.1 guanine deaminase [Betaproteobacteria bacterium]NBU49001.1 guanine deaminase [Betaproteobacteria bacterium]NBX97224.1 guanine deaminase [Betaproteobacteria bacterium]
MADDNWALRGDLLDFTGEPAWGQTQPPEVRWRPDHWVLVRGRHIEAVQAEPPGPEWRRVEHGGRLVLPGLIDTHVHAPQLDVLASYGTELLDWLNDHTFPAEARYADERTAQLGAQRFVKALLRHGTTAALAFSTVHEQATHALFEAAHAQGMRMISGKVLMNRHVPATLQDDVQGAEQACRRLIERWHGTGRCAYAVTPRFAPTSTQAQLTMAAKLLREDPSLYLQSHVAESQAEVQWVRELFPQARSYLDVYASCGLLHRRTVFAHGIWLDDEDRVQLRDAGATLAHSPTSNLFLGSGLFNWRQAHDAGVRVCSASDVGGGTSLNLLRNLAAAYQIQALLGERLTAWSALHSVTLGAAQALCLDGEMGRLEPGCAADITVWDWSHDPVVQHRLSLARGLHERVFAWFMLGDERLLRAAVVAGRVVPREG